MSCHYNNNYRTRHNYLLIVLFAIFLVSCGGGQDSSGGSDTESRSVGTTIPETISAFRSQDLMAFPECDGSETLPDVFFSLGDAFNVDNAYLLLLVSWFVEQFEPEQVSQQFKQWGFIDIEVWNNWDVGTRAFVAEHQDFVLVSYRGTSTPTEVLSNAIFTTANVDLYQINGEQSKAHRGIWEEHERVRSSVQSIIDSFSDDNLKPVIFTGHSRGAALTALQAAYHATKGGMIQSVYTFAQPRLGNAALGLALNELFGDRFYRMNYVRDVTPRVPPSAEMALPLYNEGLIPLWLSTVVESLDYDYDPGELYILDEAGYWDFIVQEDRSEEQFLFWQDLFNRFPNIVLSIPSLASYFPENHIPPVYICSLVMRM
ncbi:MAG: lipase family protein [Pseudomonadales bacterium]|nr:lipase family protein [Pseudomonadales bacterium]